MFFSYENEEKKNKFASHWLIYFAENYSDTNKLKNVYKTSLWIYIYCF